MAAIGVIDTMGLVSSVEALDVCLKAAEVRLLSAERVGGGIVSFTVTGDVSAVAAAVDAGVAAAERLGGYLRHTVIARLDVQAEQLFEPWSATPEPEPEPELELESEPERTPDPEHEPAPAIPEPEPVSEPAPKRKPAPRKPRKKPE